MMIDVLIIGAGITGTATAREISRYNGSVCVLEQAYDVAEGATKANSGIVHAGYDAVPGTLKAYYNVLGAALYPELCELLGVAYQRTGALVVAFGEDEIETLRSLLERGIRNGVRDLQIIGQPELSKMEPALNSSAVAALFVPSSAIVSPYELAFAFADDAALNGVHFQFGESVQSISPGKNGTWSVSTGQNVYECRCVVNCSGSSGACLHNLITGDHLKMVNRRGQYYLLDRSVHPAFIHTVFQCPSRMGKGVLVSPTVHGNLIIGPNAEDIDDPLDTATTDTGLKEVLEKARRTWPDLSLKTNITNFSGIRAHLDTDDFLVGPVKGKPGAFEAIGIESPGLSSAPAIAADLSRQIAEYLNLNKKAELVPFRKPAKPFHQMSDEERRNAVNNDPLYGNIICRCETVTEAEIRAAVRRPVGARSIDGIKRRTRSGMGRCQGGFCSPRVASILSEELGLPLQKIVKCGKAGKMLVGTIDDCLKEGAGND